MSLPLLHFSLAGLINHLKAAHNALDANTRVILQWTDDCPITNQTVSNQTSHAVYPGTHQWLCVPIRYVN